MVTRDELKQFLDNHPLRSVVESFPRLPGVYVMKDESGSVIYVGKAKDLRARVKSYFLGADERLQVSFLLRKVHSIEKIVVANEAQAFVLERDLISKYKPRYNVRLKDDKAFLCIRIDENSDWPRLELVRKVVPDGARYFGPFSFSYELRELLEIIKRTVPLRTCSDTVFYNRTRPCLEYQIKRCAGPCTLPVERSDYRGWIRQAIALLQGKTESVAAELQRHMDQASEDLRFEDAALLRDRIAMLQSFRAGAQLVSSRGEDRDVFALYREERLAVVAVLGVRSGRVADNRNFTLQEVMVPNDELLEAVVEQYYAERQIPPEVVLPEELANGSIVREMLMERRGAAVELTVPERGSKLRLVEIARVNAEQHFVATFNAETRATEVGRAVARLLELAQIPRRIECVDISNFQGSDTVGAIVAFFDGQPDKARYRKYRLERGGSPDDFQSIYEVVFRRLERGVAEGDLPDLLLIDGGPGQLARAVEAREQTGAQVEIVSLAKERLEESSKREQGSAAMRYRPERVYRPGEGEPILLDMGAESTHFLQRIRDEVHRFVITFHRARRSKRVFGSELDGVPGLGPERKRRLLTHFGDLPSLRKVSETEIAKVGRMPLALAKKVKALLK